MHTQERAPNWLSLIVITGTTAALWAIIITVLH